MGRAIVHKWDHKKEFLVMRCGSTRWLKGDKRWTKVTCKRCLAKRGKR